MSMPTLSAVPTLSRLRRLAALILVLVLIAPGCGGTGGGNPPQGGSPVMLDVVVCWIDANANGTADVGDQLVIKFDRSVQMGANGPVADLVVLNGSLGTSTWTNGPGFGMTIELSGPIDLSMVGKVAPAMTINLGAGNTLENPVDNTSPATPATNAQTISAGLADSGQSLGGGTCFAVLLENVNSNIAPDLILGCNGPNAAYFNDGTGVFSQGLPFIGEPAGGRDTRGVTLLDENADGIADYLVTGNGGSLVFPSIRANLVYAISAGVSPTFTHTPTLLNPGWSSLGDDETLGIGSGDFDGDGNLDVVCVNAIATDFIYFGNGAGLFNGNTIAPQVPFTPQPLGFGGISTTRCVSVGDIDGVAGLDFVTGGPDAGGTFTSWRVNGSGTAVSVTILTGLGDVRCVDLCDFDNDGDLDAVVGLGNGGGIRAFKNNGSGVFAVSGASYGTDNVFAVTCCDMNGDGFNDVIAGNANNQPNRVWLNCGLLAFVFQDSGLTLDSDSTLAITTSDPTLYPTGVDAVGVNDIAVANGSGPMRIYLSGK